MDDPTTDFARHVHLPWGYVPSGRRVRAACSCGFRTTPRADRARALSALLSEHGYTQPVCALCGTDHQAYPGHDWDELRMHYIEIVTDPASGTFLVCRDSPKSCRDGYAQRQLHLDRAAFDSFGIDLPRPRLRVVGGSAESRGGDDA